MPLGMLARQELMKRREKNCTVPLESCQTSVYIFPSQSVEETGWGWASSSRTVQKMWESETKYEEKYRIISQLCYNILKDVVTDPNHSQIMTFSCRKTFKAC